MTSFVITSIGLSATGKGTMCQLVDFIRVFQHQGKTCSLKCFKIDEGQSIPVFTHHPFVCVNLYYRG